MTGDNEIPLPVFISYRFDDSDQASLCADRFSLGIFGLDLEGGIVFSVPDHIIPARFNVLLGHGSYQGSGLIVNVNLHFPGVRVEVEIKPGVGFVFMVDGISVCDHFLTYDGGSHGIGDCLAQDIIELRRIIQGGIDI